jgi:predicted DNA binding protein
MYRLEFGVEHRGCVVNEMSRDLPQVRLICPGGFILGKNNADEILILDNPTQADVDAVIQWLEDSPKITEVEVIERTEDKAYVGIMACADPPQGFCSGAVERNRCFRIGYEIQEGGVEKWTVGAKHRSYVDALVEELRTMGELKYHRVTETSWAELVDVIAGL